MASIPEMNEARRIKAMGRLFNFDGKVMTLGAFLETKTITRASMNMRTHETKKRNLCYQPLAKPIFEYTLWYTEGGREVGTDVPRLVYAFYITTKGTPTHV